MGEFDQEFRDGFIEACLHLVNRDYDALAKDFITLGYCDPFSFKIAKEYPYFLWHFLKQFLHKCLPDFSHQPQIRMQLQKH